MPAGDPPQCLDKFGPPMYIAGEDLEPGDICYFKSGKLYRMTKPCGGRILSDEDFEHARRCVNACADIDPSAVPELVAWVLGPFRVHRQLARSEVELLFKQFSQ